LQHEFEFPFEMAQQLANCPVGTGARLLTLKREGFEPTEEDPLLVVVIDPNNASSVAFANTGNYGLPAGAPGLVPWPGGAAPVHGGVLPVGVVAAPPSALGRFISQQPRVTDKSAGGFTLFHLVNNGAVHELGAEIRLQPQFKRVSTATGLLLNVQPAPALVRVVQLDRMDGPPQPLAHFAEF
jgi:hypothetical protein